MKALVPPNDADAEGATLSAVLLDPGAFDEVSLFLRGEHFYADANRWIWTAVATLSAVGRPIDVVSVAGWLRDNGRLEQIGGTPYLAQLADATPAVAHVETHARMVVEKWRLRQLISTSQVIAAEAYACPPDVNAFVQSAEARMFAVAQDGAKPSRSVGARELVVEAVREIEAKQRKEKAPGASTGFRSLDRRIGWLRPGRLYVVAARPGMGKTSAAIQFGCGVMHGKGDRRGFLLASIEMPRSDIVNRILAQECLLDSRAIDAGFVSDADWRVVTDRSAEIARWPLIVDDTSSMTVSQLRGIIRRASRKFEREMSTKLGVVVVDYLQLMGRSDVPRDRSTNDEIEWMSSALANMAKEFDVPIILLSQLNRECEKRADKRPILADLRSSGAIEQDAWCVIGLYREDQYRKPGEQKDNSAEFVILKARGGRPGTVRAGFLPYCAKFVEQDDDDPNDEFARYSALFEDGPDFYTDV